MQVSSPQLYVMKSSSSSVQSLASKLAIQIPLSVCAMVMLLEMQLPQSEY